MHMSLSRNQHHQFIYFLTLFSLVLFWGCAKEVKEKPMNVLFILADDLGYHDLSCTGSQFYETPNIDRIAREGMWFTNGYAACQVCSPSRASIMTGQFPARHGITDWIGARVDTAWRKQGRYNQLLPPDYNRQLASEDLTIAEALKENGYVTFFSGKWHLGGEGSWPTDHGFDFNKGGWHVGSPIGGYFSPWENPNLPNHRPGENLSMRLAKETSQFIENHKDTSFFAFLSFYAVHGPIQTTQEKWQKYRNKADSIGIVDKGFEMGHFLPIRQVQDNPVYAGLVEAMDEAVGHVLNRLEELGLAEHTMIIFTSDNGGVAAGDAFATSNRPLRAGKGYQYEGGIREPYFINVPGHTQPGSINHTPVSGTDFFPTILEVLGLDLQPMAHQDGVSLWPLITGDTIPERALIWHYPHYGNQGGQPAAMIRRGDWKLIHYFESGRESLFDLSNDVSEQHDLASQFPERRQALSDELFAYLKDTNARFPRKDPVYDPGREAAYLEKIRTERWPMLEARRLEFLSPDYSPGNDWWGSLVTND